MTTSDGTKREEKEVTISGWRRAPRPLGRTVTPTTVLWQSATRQACGRVRPERLARLLAAVAHPQRVAILLKLLVGEATHRLLAKATKMKAGPLYHHIRELRSAGLLGPRVRDLYVITPKGRRTILTVLAMERLCR